MHRTSTPARRRRGLATRPGLESLEGRRLLATTVLSVTTAADAGAGSLRQALLTAASPPSPSNFVINFAIPGSGVHTITPASPLPVVPSGVTIAAWSQPGYAGKPLIEINGSAAPTYRAAGLYTEGLILKAGDGVFGLAIDGFAGDQLLVTGEHDGIQGDYIGLDATGEAAPNVGQAGISVINTGFLAIGGAGQGQADVISGNHWGIYASNAYALDIEGNAIGLDAARTKAIGNAFAGVDLVSVHDSIVGGTSAASANQVGASLIGVYLTANAGSYADYNVQVQGNQIGENVALASLPNFKYDLFLDYGANGNQVGGNRFGAIAGSPATAPIALVRDVNPANRYSGNVGFDAATQQVNLGVTSSYVPSSPVKGKVYSFTATYTVTNQGPQTATGVILAVSVAPGSSFQVVGYQTGTTGTFDPAFVQSTGATTYLIRFDPLASGQSGTITLNCRNTSGTLAGTLTGSASSDGIDVQTSNKSSHPF